MGKMIIAGLNRPPSMRYHISLYKKPPQRSKPIIIPPYRDGMGWEYLTLAQTIETMEREAATGRWTHIYAHTENRRASKAVFNIDELKALAATTPPSGEEEREQITPENLAKEFERLLKADTQAAKSTALDSKNGGSESSDPRGYSQPREIMEMAFLQLSGRSPRVSGGPLAQLDTDLCNAAWRLFLGKESTLIK